MSSNGVNKKMKLVTGLLMMVVFVAVLVAMFLPIFGDGNNGLNYMDNLYNSISKASAYYIPQVREESAKFKGRQVELVLKFEADDKHKMGPEKLAASAAALLTASGGQAKAQGNQVTYKGDLGAALAGALNDADAMFANNGEAVAKRYSGADPKTMLYSWWRSLQAIVKSLNKQEMFAEATFTDRVSKKAVETAYNFFGIEPEDIGDKWGIVLFSLIFYVLYTVWFGYSVMFLFEGAGFQLEAH